MLRQINTYLISFLAFALGINYCLFTWLNFDIIGLNSDIMSSPRYFWGLIQSVLGILLIIFVLIKNKAIVWHKYWTIVASVVFVMQLPMASLWYMMLMRDPLSALSGVVVHTLLITLIALDYLNSHKGSYLTKKEKENNVPN